MSDYPDKLSEDEVQEFSTLTTDEAPDVKLPVDRKKKSSPTTTTVTMFRQMKGYCLCTDSKGKGYMIPDVLCDGSKGLTFEVDLTSDEIIPLYNWDKEIESMLPNRETLVQNIRLALWHNGAVSREAAKENKVQQNLMRGAFPYRIEVTEEE